MVNRIKVGVLGATGAVGQIYIRLLANHPWFEVVDVAASPASAGKKYGDAVKEKWIQDVFVPENVKNLIVRDVQDYAKLPKDLGFVFSAVEMPKKEDIKAVEDKYAEMGIPVVSNNSAHRWTPDVPMLIAEINPDHTKILPIQQKKHNWKGFIAVKPNCSLQSYLTAIYALEKAGFKIDKLIITTLQAASGAGYPGVPSLDLIDNVVPFIGGEEEKTEKEPLKILGKIQGDVIVNDESIKVSATCTRVPVTDGHMACVSVKFKDKVPSKEEMIKIWKDFKGVPQELDLPMAPKQPIIYLDDDNRPQPKKDRMNDKGMAITVGRLRKDPVFDWKFVALSHNTIRGAAGGGILNAELLKAQGYLK